MYSYFKIKILLLLEQINNRSLDTEENIRLELVEEILKTIKSDNTFVNEHLLSVLKDRTLDIKVVYI